MSRGVGYDVHSLRGLFVEAGSLALGSVHAHAGVSKRTVGLYLQGHPEKEPPCIEAAISFL